MMNILYMIYIGESRPYLTNFARVKDILNESCFQMVAILIALIPVTLTTSDEALVGWMVVGVISLVLFVNMVVILFLNFMNIKYRLRIAKLKRT